MNYKRVNIDNRILIARWTQEGKTNKEIAKLLAVSPSTISREKCRNSVNGVYNPEKADELAIQRAQRPGPRKLTPAVIDYIVEKLKQGWTPEMISKRSRMDNQPYISRETIYRFIYEDAKKGGTLYTYLPRANRSRKRRCPRDDSHGRGKIKDQVSIDKRPKSIDKRIQIGHWEGDLIVGASASGYFITLVERVTRYALVGWSKTKEAEAISKEIIRMVQNTGLPIRSITFDNGKEFANHQEISKELGIRIYFAHPYHSWERGTNENTNGLIRRLYPKGTSLSSITKTDIKNIHVFLNDRPKKCLSWLTPNERMQQYILKRNRRLGKGPVERIAKASKGIPRARASSSKKEEAMHKEHTYRKKLERLLKRSRSA